MESTQDDERRPAVCLLLHQTQGEWKLLGVVVVDQQIIFFKLGNRNNENKLSEKNKYGKAETGMTILKSLNHLYSVSIRDYVKISQSKAPSK